MTSASKVTIAALVITAMISGLIYWVANREASTTYVQAVVVAAEPMCVPYKVVGTGRRSSTVHPRGITERGVGCWEKNILDVARQRGYRETERYWNALVKVPDGKGGTAIRAVTTYRMPLVKLGPDGTRINSNANELPTYWNTQNSRIKLGDILPVAVRQDQVAYDPNELRYTQYKWVAFGVLAVFGVVAWAFAGDFLPVSQQERNYETQLRGFYARWNPYQRRTFTAHHKGGIFEREAE
jgi:hypothetical protein